MTTMYIACNNRLERGYFMGDVIVAVKVAYLFAENERPDEIILSLHHNDPLNFLWDKFIRVHDVEVVFDHPVKADKESQYTPLNIRRRDRVVEGKTFDVYKELYPRLDGGERQVVLAKSERGLGRANIFEYLYYGQETFTENPVGTLSYGPTLIDWKETAPGSEGEIFIAPYEKCQGNKQFTIHFWETVVYDLINQGCEVTVNGRANFLKEWEHPRLKRTFVSFRELFTQIQGHCLVLTGNTGIGWVAASVGTPMIACEKDMIFVEYSYEKCGCDNLLETLTEPDAALMVRTVMEWRREHAAPK